MDVLRATMPIVQAREQLDDPSYAGQLTMGEFEALLLRAGYAEDVAHRAAMRRGWARLVVGVSM